MPPRWNENRLTAKLGIDYPIIQDPLGGLSSQKLTAAVVAAKTRQKPRDPGRDSRQIGSTTPMGRAKRQSFNLPRRIGFLDLIGQ
jgi:hypothetical protein